MPWPVHVASAEHRDVVGKELKRNYLKNGLEQRRHGRYGDGAGGEPANGCIALRGNDQHRDFTLHKFADVGDASFIAQHGAFILRVMHGSTTTGSSSFTRAV